MNADWKVEGPACWVQRANMWQDCSLTVVQRKTAFLEQSCGPEFDMFGSMPWCSFPWHKLLPRLTPKNCYKVYVYSLNLIDEFTSLFLSKVIVAGLPRKAFPRKLEKVDIGHLCFSVIAQATQDSPKASPRKNFIEQLKLLLKWMLIERWRAQHVEFNVPTCGKIAVWQLCREKQPFWNSHAGLNLTCLDQCHGVGSHGTSSSQGRRQRIVIKSTVSICLQTKFDWWVYILGKVLRWLLQVCLGKPSHGNRKK